MDEPLDLGELDDETKALLPEPEKKPAPTPETKPDATKPAEPTGAAKPDAEN